MKKKVLTLLGALAALGLAACDPAAPASSAPASNPASSQPAASSKPASSKPASSKPASSSKPADPVADATGHIWAADTDVAADTEAGTVAFKKAVTTTPATDKAVRYKVNQSVVTYPEGSSRKTDTPEGYTKLDGDGQMLTFKFKSDKLSKGKLYLFGVMDNYSSNTNQGLYYNGKPNVEVKVNDAIVDVSAWANHTYADYLEEGGEGTNSKEGYVPVGDVVLKEGVNEVSYKRVQTRNMLIKDFVFVVEETTEWSDPTTVAADATAGTVAYKKYTNNLDGSIKIEFKALDGAFGVSTADATKTSVNKNGTPDGYLKLDKNGMNISYKFNLDINLDGKIYQRGMMDNYSGNNKQCTYYSQQGGAKHGNFKADLNGTHVYIGDKKDITYAEMLGDGTQTIGSTTYSEVGDCLIGDGFLKNGENNFYFERVDSFNLAVSEFVFIGKAANAHTAPEATAEWHMDEISHWQEVANDSFKWNRADNEWEADPDHPDVPATCVSTGKTYEREKESHLTREKDTPINPDAHANLTVKNSDGKDVYMAGECPDCHETVEGGTRIAATSYSNAAAVDSVDASKGVKAKSNAEVEWKVVLPKDGYFSIALDMKCDKNGNETMSKRGFALKVNDTVVATTFDGTQSPDALGMSASNAVTIVLADSVQITRDEHNEVSIKLSCTGYRLYYTNYLVLTEVAAPTPSVE